jgi:hypothetical protein
MFDRALYRARGGMYHHRVASKIIVECPHMLGCTANDASTHHFKMPLPLALSISGIVRVPLMYLIKWTNFSSRTCRVLALS